METQQVVSNECDEAVQARGCDVVVFAEDVVGTVVTADGECLFVTRGLQIIFVTPS